MWAVCIDGREAVITASPDYDVVVEQLDRALFAAADFFRQCNDEPLVFERLCEWLQRYSSSSSEPAIYRRPAGPQVLKCCCGHLQSVAADPTKR